MGVCRFFLEGRCRYGQNCRNEHPRGGNGGGGGQYNNRQYQYNNNNDDRQYNNQYKFDRRQSASQRNIVKPPSFQNQNRFNVFNSNNEASGSGQQHHNNQNYNRNQQQHRQHEKRDEEEEIIKQIKSDIEQWGKSKMWPFSCYSYDKGKNCLLDLADISPEEMRVLYHLHGHNTYSKFNSDIEAQYNHIKLGLFNMPVDKHSPDAQTVLNQINSIAQTSPSEKLQIAELYGKGHNFKVNNLSNATAPPLPLPATGGISSQMSFNNPVTNNTVPANNIFAQTQPALPVATAGPSSASSEPVQTTSISIFGSTSTAASADVDLSTYRKHESIFPFEMEQFKANKFDNLDNIPEFPPSKELCV